MIHSNYIAEVILTPRVHCAEDGSSRVIVGGTGNRWMGAVRCPENTPNDTCDAF